MDSATRTVRVSDRLGEVTITGRREGDPYIFGWLQLGNVFEPVILKMLERLTPPGSRLVDVGANLGWCSVLGSRIVGPTGIVVSIEPDPLNLAFLRRNILQNGCANVQVVATAAGSKRGKATLYRSPDNAGDHRLSQRSERAESVVVPVRSIDRYVRTKPGQICVVKVDTQGYEAGVIEGMQRGLHRASTCRLLFEFWPHGILDCGSSVAQLCTALRASFAHFWLLSGDEVRRISLNGLPMLASNEYTPASETFADVVALQAKDISGVRIMSALETRDIV